MAAVEKKEVDLVPTGETSSQPIQKNNDNGESRDCQGATEEPNTRYVVGTDKGLQR